MRKTNSKAVKEAVRNYLRECVADTMVEYGIEPENPYIEYLRIMREEMQSSKYRTEFEMFEDWLQGLGGFGADVFYFNSKRGHDGKVQDILQDWLDQTDEEISKYDYWDSTKLMVKLCWRELNYLAEHETGNGRTKTKIA